MNAHDEIVSGEPAAPVAGRHAGKCQSPTVTSPGRPTAAGFRVFRVFRGFISDDCFVTHVTLCNLSCNGSNLKKHQCSRPCNGCNGPQTPDGLPNIPCLGISMSARIAGWQPGVERATSPFSAATCRRIGRSTPNVTVG